MLRSRRPAEWPLELPTSKSVSKSKANGCGRYRSHHFNLNYLRKPTFCRKTVLGILLASLALCYVILHGGSQHRPSIFKVNPLSGKEQATRSYLSPGIPPLVDRSVLDKLARIESSDPDENFLRSGAGNTVGWPPAVTRLPDAHAVNVRSPVTNITAFDTEFCGTSPCRLLLPLRIGEQESKARMHFLQLLQLAKVLGRTLVLPNVGKSRLGTCFRFDFGTYYDINTLVTIPEGEDGRPTVLSMIEFRNWTMLRPNRPTGQMISISTKSPIPGSLSQTITTVSNSGANFVTDHDADSLDPKLSRCIPNKVPRLSLHSYSPVFVSPFASKHDATFGASVADGLAEIVARGTAVRSDPLTSGGSDVVSQPDVLLVDWDLRHPAFPEPSLADSTSLDYSPKLTSLSMKLTAPLEPYLAVHWRMETMLPEVLPRCAAALVDTLFTLLTEPSASDIQTVWFASDYPYSISAPRPQKEMQIQDENVKSGTFKDLAHEHEVAIDVLRAAFGRGGLLEQWRITGLAEELEKVRRDDGEGYEDGLLEDPGVLGILDKIIAMKGALFVTSAKGCGRVSSFTRQIVDVRRNTNGQLRNVVERFNHRL